MELVLTLRLVVLLNIEGRWGTGDGTGAHLTVGGGVEHQGKLGNCTCFGLRDACNKTPFLCAYTAASDSTV
jgi:hypothetical protein